MRCQHPRLSWDILFGKGICPDCDAKIVAYNEWPTSTPPEGTTTLVWHPASERPERSGYYLVADEYKRVEFAICEHDPVSGKLKFNWPKVTHWTPLPSCPPQEQR